MKNKAMKTIYLKIEVPDDLPIIAQRIKLSNNFYPNVPFTEIQFPTDEEIENKFPGDPHSEAYVGNLLNKARREGARWVIAKIKNK